MSSPRKRVAIIQFPGCNCEAESAAAIRRNGMEAEEFLWNRDPSELADFDGFFIVGGFSYEDRSRAGVLASLDPVLGSVAAQADLGKPVLGICNGAQVLVESGLVPGLRHTSRHLERAQAIEERLFTEKKGSALCLAMETEGFEKAEPGEYARLRRLLPED